jgi:hypothetical protein
MVVKPGLRLRSAVCGTEVIVVRAPGGDLDVRCGGQPMLPFDAAMPVPGPSIAAGLDEGTLIGKRYGDQDLEILCTKPGQGSISVGDEPLPVLAARQLPSSD